MVRKLFLTPPTLPDAEQCRGLVIPQSKEWLAVFSQALLATTYSYNYEQVNPTDLTTEEAAAWAYEIYTAWLSATCSDGLCIPRLGGQRLTRKNPQTGEFEQIADDGVTWEEPSGDIAIPAPAPRQENTDDAKICAAAANAANVLRVFYEQALDYYDQNIDPATALDNVLDGFGAFAMDAIGTLLRGAHPLIGFAWEVLYNIFGEITNNVWSNDFSDDLRCLLLDYAEVQPDGTVTFRYGDLQNGLFSLGNYDGNRILLVWQVYYFVSIIGADGMNAAGATTQIVDPICACGSWGREWLFANMQNTEWTKLQGLDTLDNSILVNGEWTGSFAAVTCTVNVPAETTIMQIGVRSFMAASNYGQSSIVCRASPSTSFIHSGGPDDFPYSDALGFVEASYWPDLMRTTVVSVTGDGTDRTFTVTIRSGRDAYLNGFAIWGVGPCPFVTGVPL